MGTTNAWDTDPYGDPTAASPWLGTAAAGTDPTAAPAPTTAPTSTAAAPAASTDPSGVTSSPWTDPAQPTTTPQTSATGTAGATTYDAHLTNIAQATDPAQQATAQDGLARQLQTDLEADGHVVKWTTPTTLTVDGRPYELGTGGKLIGVTDPTAKAADPTTGGASPADLTAAQDYFGKYLTDHGITSWGEASDGVRAYTAQRAQGLSHDAALQAALKSLGWDKAPGAGGTGATGTRPTGGHLSDPSYAAQFVAWAATQPGVNPSVKNDPNYWIQKFTSGAFGDDEDYALARMMQAEGPPESGGGAGGGLTSPWLTTPGGPKSLADYPNWSPSTPGYTPNFIDPSASELPGYKDILDTLNTPGEGDAALQKLVQGIVEHPQTLSDQDIEELKAKSAEEAAVAGQSQDEELQHFGYNTGLDTSPWLAGQRAQNAWNRSNSTITANRGIDIAAADRRQADRQQAAQIGTAYSSFQSSKKAQAVGLAVNAALGKAGEQRSRTQLNESLKQAATQLGLTKDSLVMTYLGHIMTDLTNNKQLDLNFDVDMKKLAEQSEEFKQTLLLHMHELAQQDDQFRANYGLAASEFQHRKDQDAWERAKAAIPT